MAGSFDPAKIRENVVFFALANIGYGEVGENNAGPFIEAIGGRAGDYWCGLFAGYCLRKAFVREGLHEPSCLFRRPGRPEPGARRLGLGILQIPGAIVTLKIAEALPGDIAVIPRLGGAHALIIEDPQDGHGVTRTIEGNLGEFPSRVKAHHRDFHHDDLIGIYGIR